MTLIGCFFDSHTSYFFKKNYKQYSHEYAKCFIIILVFVLGVLRHPYPDRGLFNGILLYLSLIFDLSRIMIHVMNHDV